MSHRPLSVRDRIRGVLVLLVAAGLAVPLLVAAGGSRTDGDTVAAVVALARAQVGDRYVWGGTGPDTWDCSGLTSYVWREAGGVVLPRVSGDQQKRAVAIPREQLLPGDLAFFGDPVSHVALYVGEGRVVDASSAKTGVLERALWSAKDVRYGRVPRPDMPAVTPWTPPSPAPSASPSPSSSGSPSASSSGSPSASAAPSPRATSVAGTRPTTSPTPGTSSSPSTQKPAGKPVASTGSTPRPTTAPATRPTATPAATATKPATTKPASKPASKPVAKPAAPTTTAKPVAGPAAPTTTAPVAKPAAAPAPRPAVRALTTLPATQARPSSAVALKAVAAARALAGATDGTDTSLVRAVWLRAGGLRLPLDRGALVARARQVPRPDVRVGDLVSYGTPATQVYLYAGHGYMVGWSAEHSAVVVRRVHTGDIRFLRLPG